jgi:diguanylate cyclase
MQNIQIHAFQAGEWIFHEHDEGDCAYLVEEGEVLILLEREEKHVPLGIYGEGSLFGEMAIIDNQKRSASAFAYTNCRLRTISRDHLNYRLEQADPILKVCINVLMGHLRKTLTHLDPEDHSNKSNITSSLPDMLQLAADQAVLASTTGQHTYLLQEKISTSNNVNIGQITIENPHQIPKIHPLAYDAFSDALKVLDIEQELAIAIKEGQLVLFYQPIMEARLGRLAGFEALMRWIHPEKGLISPIDFIPIAERSGQIVDMTYWAIDVACSDLLKLHDKLLGHLDLAPYISESLFMSVNFSTRDFLDAQLMRHVNELLIHYHLPPQSLKIEITESVLMNSPHEVQKVLNECKENGASVAIDDFGTGYSSLSYLQSMPVDTLKIDQGFIRPMHENDRHMALVESIIHLAQRLNMKTVAEGVETEADLQKLNELDCDFLQGYYFARPMPLADVVTWAEKYWNVSSDDFMG